MLVFVMDLETLDSYEWLTLHVQALWQLHVGNGNNWLKKHFVGLLSTKLAELNMSCYNISSRTYNWIYIHDSNAPKEYNNYIKWFMCAFCLTHTFILTV